MHQNIKSEEFVHEVVEEVVTEDKQENGEPLDTNEESEHISEEELIEAVEEAENESVKDESAENSVDESDSDEKPVEVGDIPKDKEHHEHIYDILTNQDEITWKTIIVELIKTEQMDPWDVNVSLLSKMYIKTLKKLKEMNLQLSGKILLAAALLLRIKSTRLVGSDLMEFDRLIASGEQNEEDDLYDDGEYDAMQEGQVGIEVDGEDLKLMPKTPQPRQRKVSMYDLIDALAIALNVRRRRILNNVKVKEMHIPEAQFDLSSHMSYLMKIVMERLEGGSDRVNFKELVPDDSRMATIHTFIPLLHLTNARKTNLEQKDHFDDVWVKLVDGATPEIDEEIEASE